MNAWTFQDRKQLAKLGDDCPWSVGSYDPDGKRKSKTIGSKSLAEKFARKVEGQLAAGLYRNDARKTWADFKAEYQTRIVDAMPPNSRLEVERALEHFGDIIKPAKMLGIKTQSIDQFVAERRQQRDRREDETISLATVNKELRCIKAALRIAFDWGYLPVVPKVRMLRKPVKLARFISSEHFAEIYRSCDSAKFPLKLPYPAGDWWRGLLSFAYMTGWRVGECLALRRADLDLESGTAITRAADNKGNRDESVRLHPVVIEHLRKLTSFHPVVFPWLYHERTLWVEFARIQTAAGVHLDCGRDHEHTDACHLYGFHDFRRAIATMSAPAMSDDELQQLMRHKSYLTTKRYINMTGRLDHVVEALHVPAVLKAAQA
jgi:integrase